MKTRNTILSGIAIALVALLAIPMIYADTEIGGPIGGNTAPKAWVLKKCFDLCNENDGYDAGDMDGGSVPGGPIDNEDVQNSGCVDFSSWNREGNYLFSGEQIGFLVVARDLDGAEDIVSAYLHVDGEPIVKCNVINPDTLGTCTGGAEPCHTRTTEETCKAEAGAPNNCVWYPFSKKWCDHDISGVLQEYPTQQGESDDVGWDPTYDKLYKCVLTAIDDWYNVQPLTVEVTDEALETACTQVENFCFNPEVALSIDPSEGSSIEFEPGTAGDLVYSTNGLVIENDASCEVAIGVWLGGHDWVATNPAKCPESNVLDVDEYMDFRCELNDGTYIDQDWVPVENKNLKETCADIGKTCFNLEPALNHDDNRPNDLENVLLNGQTMKCLFKLEIPTPCIGGPFLGDFLVLMRAI